MKVMSFNVGVWTRNRKKSDPNYWPLRMTAMHRMIRDVNPDVICFQEMSYPANLFIPGGYKRAGFSASHHIYCRRMFRVGGTGFRIHFNYADIEGVRVINVHGTWKAKMKAVCADILAKMTEHTIVAGDFNIGLSKCREYGFGYSVREGLGIEPQDTYKHFKHPDTNHAELDHVFVEGLKVKTYEIVTDGYGVDRISDHYPVVVETASE